MTTTAQSIIREAQELLQDTEGTRWPATELVAHLNDGQRDIATIRPDLFTILAAIALVAGPRQALPAACVDFVEMPRNTNGAALRQADRNMLDAVEPSWYTKAGVQTIKHFCYDAREPNVFWVYPPAAVGASVDAVYSTMPADVATPSGASYTTVAGNIDCPDVCKNSLLHFVLFRAFAKDAEFGGNAAMSAANYQLFKAGIAADAATGQAIKPTITEAAQ